MKKTTIITVLTVLFCLFFCAVNAHAVNEPDPRTHDHEMTEWVVSVAPTCSEWGFEQRCCTGCTYFECRSINALGHDCRVISVTEPTCEENGYTTFECNNCGMISTGYTKYSDGHNWTNWNVLEVATCSNEGLEERHCEDCGIREYIVTEPAHQFETVILEPATCIKEGIGKQVCTLCQAEGYTFPLKKTWHRWNEWTTVETATCTTDGHEERTCKDCGLCETRELNASGHCLEKTVIKPTCESGGYTIYACKNCDVCYTRDKTDAVDHEFGSWKVSKTAMGTSTRTCKHCGTTETKNVCFNKKPLPQKERAFAPVVASHYIANINLSVPCLRMAVHLF